MDDSRARSITASAGVLVEELNVLVGEADTDFHTRILLRVGHLYYHRRGAHFLGLLPGHVGYTSELEPSPVRREKGVNDGSFAPHTLSSAYTVASRELAAISLLVKQQKTEEDWSAFVNDSEDSISREHTLWRAWRT